MKIKTKLLALILVMLSSITLATVIYVGFNLSVKQINSEKNYLQLYRNSLNASHSDLFRFLIASNKVVDQAILFDSSLEKKSEAFKELSNIKLLPLLNPEVKDALTNITNLETHQSSGVDKFHNATDDLLSNTEKIIGSNKNFILSADSENFSGFTGRDIIKLKFYINKMKNELNYLEIGFQTSINIIDEQYAIIEKQVNQFEFIGNMITLAIFIIVIIVSLLISSTIAKKISKSVLTIGKSLSVMATGDLTNVISVESKDEIGSLSNNMNSFQNELKDSLNKIKDFSNQNENIKTSLIEAATDASQSSVIISKNINSVDKQIITLNNNILKSSQQINQINGFTSDLNNHISDQMSMVEESTASITEMIASIASVSKLTEKNQIVINNLQETAKDGDNQINETTDIIEDINASVHNIGAMAQVIQDISDQTNLLAMNAAIEAAHAGDAGKGFAVVADEIRKLSEASHISSNDISRNLKEIIKKFEKASISGINTREAFGNIYENIKEVSNSLLEISSSTSELNIGGKQILEAMENLTEISGEVHSKSNSMKNNAESVKVSMEEVSDISTTVTNSMSEVNTRFLQVSDLISGLEKTSNNIGDISRDLNSEVDKFKTSI